LELNGTHQLLIYADDVNILGGSVHTIKKNTAALLVGSKEVNADKTKYTVMFRDQNAGQSHNIETNYSSFEMLADVQYLGKTLTIKILLRKKLRAD
jgi:hypothetical protein